MRMNPNKDETAAQWFDGFSLTSNVYIGQLFHGSLANLAFD